MPIATIALCLGLVSANLLRMSISSPENELSGLESVEKTNEPMPVGGCDELEQLPGWPLRVQSGLFSPARGITLADFDNDGRLELVMPAHTSVHCWRYDGTPYPGWPVALSGDSCQYAAAAADVDRDGEIEVAVSTRGLVAGGAVYLIGENGRIKPGWPYRGQNGNFEDSPTLADVNGDDTLEVIVLERNYPIGKVHVLRHNATELLGWPQPLDHVPAAGCGVADINRDGTPEIVALSYYSCYVFHPDGSLLPGWPLTQPNGRSFSYQSPALADIDGDDTLDIVFGMHQNGGGCYVVRHNGVIQPGWPFSYSNWTYCPPTVADLYRDGELKVIHGIAGGMVPLPVLYAFNPNGTLLPGFPYVSQSGASAEGNLTVCDLDGDGDMEIIFTSNMITSADTLGFLWAVHHDGSLVSGWPLRPYGFTYLNGATVADVNDDDTMDIVGVSSEAGQLQVSVWNAGVPFNRQAWEWPTYQFDMQRTGRYVAPSAGIAEERPGRTGLVVTVRPTVVRAGGEVRLSSSVGLTVGLFDESGRQVAILRTDSRDAVTLPTGISPGVYFLRATGGRCVRLSII